MSDQNTRLTRSRFLILAATICLLALVLREQFVLITQVDRHRANLWIFLLSAAASFTLLWRYRRTPLTKFSPLLVALCCIYVTLVHTVFQAEPRYAIPYRPFQMLLLVTALSSIASWLVSKRQKLLGRTPGMNQKTPRAARGHMLDAVDDRSFPNR